MQIAEIVRTAADTLWQIKRMPSAQTTLKEYSMKGVAFKPSKFDTAAQNKRQELTFCNIIIHRSFHL